MDQLDISKQSAPSVQGLVEVRISETAGGQDPPLGVTQEMLEPSLITCGEMPDPEDIYSHRLHGLPHGRGWTR